MDDNLILWLILGAVAYFAFIKGGGTTPSGPALTFVLGPDVQMTGSVLSAYAGYCSKFGGTANTNSRSCVVPYSTAVASLPIGTSVQDWANQVNAQMLLDPRVKNGTATWDPTTMTYTIHNGWVPWGM